MTDIGTVFYLGLNVVLLWLLIYFGWRPYRLDNVRNDFFELRNELFLYAAHGGVSFDDPAYKMLRDRINALIRFAHMLTLTRSLLFYAMHQKRPLRGLEQKNRTWATALGQTRPEARQKLTDIENRMSRRCARQVVTGAPPVLVIVLLYVVALSISKIFHSNDEDTGLRIAKELNVELIEEQAVFAQQYEREEDCLTHA